MRWWRAPATSGATSPARQNEVPAVGPDVRRFRLHPAIWATASTHFVCDAYGNMYAPLLPLLIPRLGLSLQTIGVLAMTYQLASSVSQLGFGTIADRWRPRVLLMGGPVLSVLVLSGIGSATTVPMLAALLFIGGLGSTNMVRLSVKGDRVVGEERLLQDLQPQRERLRDVRQGPDGALYLLTDNSKGRLLKLVPKG